MISLSLRRLYLRREANFAIILLSREEFQNNFLLETFFPAPPVDHLISLLFDHNERFMLEIQRRRFLRIRKTFYDRLQHSMTIIDYQKTRIVINPRS